MNIYQKIQKKLVTIVMLVMLFSPLSFSFAEEAQTTEPVVASPSAQTESTPQTLPVRGVDESNLGPQQTAPVVEPPKDVQATPIAVEGVTTTNNPEVTVPVTDENIQNVDMGKNSENSTVKEGESQKNIDNTNNATVTNDVRGVVGTAGNVVMGERGNIAINTGDAESVLSLINLINSIFAGLGGNVAFVYKNVDGDLNGNYVIDPSTGKLTTFDGKEVVINDNTGRNSENLASLGENDQTSNRNTSLSNLINKVNLEANTGDNMISNKVGDNGIKTGDAEISLNLLNFLNSTFVVGDFGVVGILNILGDWTGNLLLPKSIFGGFSAPNITTAENSSTGKNSENTATAKTDSSKNIDTNNVGQINNNISLDGNTGGNMIDSKVGDANIITGSVNLLLNQKNFANITIVGDVIYMAFVNVLGKWFGSDLVGKIFGFSLPNTVQVNNQNTGTNSANTAKSTENNTQNTATNNQGILQNLVNIVANTGGNQISSERGDSTIQTGNVSVLANIVNFLNTNFTGKRIVMLFVNVFGDWYGNIDFEKENPAVQAVLSQDSGAPVTPDTNNINNTFFQKAMKTVAKAPQYAKNGLGAVSKIQKPDEKSDPASMFLPKERDENQIALFLADHLNLVFFILFVGYLSFLVAYLKLRKNNLTN